MHVTGIWPGFCMHCPTILLEYQASSLMARSFLIRSSPERVQSQMGSQEWSSSARPKPRSANRCGVTRTRCVRNGSALWRVLNSICDEFHGLSFFSKDVTKQQTTLQHSSLLKSPYFATHGAELRSRPQSTCRIHGSHQDQTPLFMLKIKTWVICVNITIHFGFLEA